MSDKTGLEIERKFLVKNDEWRDRIQKTTVIEQHYLPFSAKDLALFIDTIDALHAEKHVIAFHPEKGVLGSVPIGEKIKDFGEDNLSFITDKTGRVPVDNDKVEARVRLKKDKYLITIKAQTDIAGERYELEFEIPPTMAQKLLDCKLPGVKKTRHEVVGPDGLTWEVDVFEGVNKGLITAEIELPNSTYDFLRPNWLGQDVTEEKRYSNCALASHPVADWTLGLPFIVNPPATEPKL